MGHSWRRPRWVAGGAFAVVLLVVVLYWFQPQKLLIDKRVDEAVPTAPTRDSARDGTSTDTDDGTAGRTTQPAPPSEVASGDFVSLDHTTTGRARVLELADGSLVLRIEALRTDNGPDLFVYLSTNPPDGEEGGFDDDFVNLGRLKGNEGDQNYDIPAGTAVDRFASVVIWCDRFNSAFGAAPLS